jgi:hypothetical protein
MKLTVFTRLWERDQVVCFWSYSSKIGLYLPIHTRLLELGQVGAELFIASILPIRNRLFLIRTWRRLTPCFLRHP